MSPLLLLLIALLPLSLGVGIAVFFLQQWFQPEPSPVQDRLRQFKLQEAVAEGGGGAAASDTPHLFRLNDSPFSNEALGAFLQKFSFTAHLQKLLKQADIAMPVDRFVSTFLVAPVLVTLPLGALTGNLVVGAAGPLVAFLAYYGAVMRRSGRLKKFTTQLPDALSLITSSLRAGHSFQSALGVVVTELPDPISSEFRQIVNDLNLGIPVKKSLERFVLQLDPLPDARMFATAVLIQREAGGNLAEILDKLGFTIRERFKLKGQVSALTGQARLTGYILGGAPAALMLFLSVVFPSYTAPLWGSVLGKLALGVAAILQIIGFVIMRKIVDIRV